MRKTDRPSPVPAGVVNTFALGRNRVLLLLREIERQAHRQVLSDCQLVMHMAMLSPAQWQAVAQEAKWRRQQVSLLTSQIHSARAVLRYHSNKGKT